ncbi:MAG TPA: BlaI/MecI/CopY family transcriptional regulator [Streptosporangiaceae bacterium]|nr:BlaI/MecI/CopY family transcriptional regulator [Streptosporangiaceae bacterium]
MSEARPPAAATAGPSHVSAAWAEHPPARVPHLGPLESAIMDVAWSAGVPVTVRAVLAELRYTAGSGGSPAYTTVMTVMSILWRKGMLSRANLPSRPGRPGQPGRPAVWWYHPRLTREQYLATAIRGILACAPDQAAVLRLIQPSEPPHPPEPDPQPTPAAPLYAT